MKALERLALELLPLLYSNPSPYKVEKELESKGFSCYPAHVFKGKGFIVKRSMFAVNTEKPPFPHVPTKIVSQYKQMLCWVVQPICEKPDAVKIWEFLDEHEEIASNVYDLHDGNIGVYKNVVCAFDW